MLPQTYTNEESKVRRICDNQWYGIVYGLMKVNGRQVARGKEMKIARILEHA